MMFKEQLLSKAPRSLAGALASSGALGRLFAAAAGLFAAWVVAVVIGYGGVTATLGLIGLPFAAGTLVLVYRSPRTGLHLIVHLSFAITALSRYLPFSLGTVMDLLLLGVLGCALLKMDKADWNGLPKAITLPLLGWLLLTLLEVANPEAYSMQAWALAIRSTSLQMCLTILLALLLLKEPRDFDLVLTAWFAWSVLGAVYGMQQLYLGPNRYELAWLAEGAAKTHILWGKLRVFSFHSDAGTFGVSQAHACLAAAILVIHTRSVRRRIAFGVVALLCLYGMAISGTRGALFVLIVGFAAYFVVRKNLRVLVMGFLCSLICFGILKYTSLGDGNYHIHRMRSALDPNDPSLQVRLNNQLKLSQYLSTRPFGGGIGSVGYWGERFSPHSFLGQMPTDSWYVRIWAETGWIGLTYYLTMLAIMLGYGFRQVVRVKDEAMRGKAAAFYAGIAGVAAASYGNEVWAAMPIAPLTYICIALYCKAPALERSVGNGSGSPPMRVRAASAAAPALLRTMNLNADPKF